MGFVLKLWKVEASLSIVPGSDMDFHKLNLSHSSRRIVIHIAECRLN